MSLFYRFTVRTLWCYFKLLHRHKVYYPEGKYSYSEGAILAANHASFYDPPLIAVSWNTPISFLARKTLFDNAFLKAIITRLNAYPIRGGSDLATLKLATSLLQSGHKIVIFPEGTRTKTGNIHHFKKGVSMLALRADCAIIPIYIHGSFEAWPYSKKLPSVFGKHTACVIGKPILPKEILSDAIDDPQQQISDVLFQEISKLREWYIANIQ